LEEWVASNETSVIRLYLMRLLYLMNVVLLGLDVWPVLINHTGPWDPVRGVAFSFWAALSTLSILGLRYPLKMVPVLLLQFLYKLIWLAAVALPMWSAVRSTDLGRAMSIGAVVDFVVIPWGYVFATYVTPRGERWRVRHEQASTPGCH
jgi:hypothetical protein